MCPQARVGDTQLNVAKLRLLLLELLDELRMLVLATRYGDCVRVHCLRPCGAVAHRTKTEQARAVLAVAFHRGDILSNLSLLPHEY